jgi:uncharacterized protein
MSYKDELQDICCALLKSAKTIAVVGLSDKQGRTSRAIAETLVTKGYKVVGVNPNISKSGEIDIYNNLTEIPFPIDIVNVFRRSETIPELVSDILKIKPKALWLQQGIRNDEAVKPIMDAGIITVQDRCIAVCYNLCKDSFV